MSQLFVESLTLPVADLGPENPLPPLARPPEGVARLVADAGVPSDVVRGMEYGRPRDLMPYLMQDGYGRDRQPGQVRMAVLDNGVLRARFALDFGGRLWSLRHLPTGRDLVYENAMVQPANLALRNAWLAGGVEWNIGIRGHSPLTCSPMHAARVDGPGGVPMLRMWEYERLRGVVFQVDVWLPAGSPVLYVHCRIQNPHSAVVPMYWWTNIAVAQRPDVRVLAAADSAYRSSYDRRLTVQEFPQIDGVDRSYPARAERAADYFFVPGSSRPWIAALDGSGRGLVHSSTARLPGRKLFVWGEQSDRWDWQQWLTGDNGPYCEIQAGLAATQYEHVPMPAGASWSWVETFGMAEVDPSVVHGPWPEAVAAVDAVRSTLACEPELDAAHRAAKAVQDRSPVEMLHNGSGWAALEQQRRKASGEPALPGPGTPFDVSTLGRVQEPFVALLDTGDLPTPDLQIPPAGYVVGEDWEKRFADAPATWASQLHRGVCAHSRGDLESAAAAYEYSLALADNPWALRNLALARCAGGDVDPAADLLVSAHGRAPHVWQLAVEAATALLKAGRGDACLRLIENLPNGLRRHGRIRLMETRAALAVGQVPRAGAILEDGLVVNDLREGEDTLTQLRRDYEAAVQGDVNQ